MKPLRLKHHSTAHHSTAQVSGNASPERPFLKPITRPCSIQKLRCSFSNTISKEATTAAATFSTEFLQSSSRGFLQTARSKAYKSRTSKSTTALSMMWFFLCASKTHFTFIGTAQKTQWPLRDSPDATRQAIKTYLSWVKKSVTADYAQHEVAKNASLCSSPDRKLRKHAILIKRLPCSAFALPDFPIMEPKAHFNGKPKPIVAAAAKNRFRLVERNDPEKLPVSDVVQRKLQLAAESTVDLEHTFSENLARINRQWDVYAQLMRTLQKRHAKQKEGNGSTEFYLWQTAKDVKRKRSKSSLLLL